MQFAGECPHASSRSVAPDGFARLSAQWTEKGVAMGEKLLGSLKAMMGFPPGIKP